jgi:hypothetical protein
MRNPNLRRITRCDGYGALREAEGEAIVHRARLRSVDFSRYLQVVDSDNPMHRLWSDSPWLKYRLAQGCYWRRCAFCDTELEYVSRFSPAEIRRLLAAADAASSRTGLYGLHFVDEAMPMKALLSFARGIGLAAAPESGPSTSGATSDSTRPGPRTAASTSRPRASSPSRAA